MRTCLLLTLVAGSLLLAACAMPAQPAPVAPSSVPATEVEVAEVEVAPTAAEAQVAAAEEAQTAVTETTPVATGGIQVEALKNATYSGVYDEPITLTDGLYEGEPYVEGDLSRPTVATIEGTELYGDLDGDGVEDSVVFLLERGGGSGAFTYVAAQLNRDGQPVDACAVRIEDRIGVRSATIKDGQVVLDLILQGPGDAACCGSHKARKTYALEEGKLVETTAEGGDLVRVSVADLDGTTWTLLKINDDQPALADTEVTISFQEGQFSGSGGCNSYSGRFSLGEDNPFVMTVGPFVATRMICPEPILEQETAYFSALENVAQWGYHFGHLALYYLDDLGTPARLLFAPAGGEITADDDTGAMASRTPPITSRCAATSRS